MKFVQVRVFDVLENYYSSICNSKTQTRIDQIEIRRDDRIKLKRQARAVAGPPDHLSGPTVEPAELRISRQT